MKKQMNFGKALKALKKGKKVQRNGWNGKEMFLVLAYPEYPGKRFNVSIEFNKTFEGVSTSMDNFIAIKTVQNTLVPWLASQTDILAEDWEIVD